MTQKEAAVERVRVAVGEYKTVNEVLSAKRQELAEVCKAAYADGVNDREMHEISVAVGFPISRARIQQYRRGNPKKDTDGS